VKFSAGMVHLGFPMAHVQSMFSSLMPAICHGSSGFPHGTCPKHILICHGSSGFPMAHVQRLVFITHASHMSLFIWVFPWHMSKAYFHHSCQPCV
jgi:hypothetical protein